MRLKRKDLIEEFELVVQQEIVNHNNVISANNQAIQELKENIEQQSCKSDKSIGEIHSKFGQLNVQIKELKDALKSLSTECAFQNNDVNKGLDQQEQMIKALARHFDKLDDDFHSLNDSFIQLATEHSCVKKKVLEISQFVVAETNSLIQRFKNDLSLLRDEILNLPSESLAIKNCLEKKIQEKDADILGLKEEIEILKRSQYLMSKKIENLYTLNDRLNKKVS